VKKQPTVSDWIILGAGAVMFIGSIFPFVKFSIGRGRFAVSETRRVWSTDGLFPLSWWPVLLGVAMAVVIGLELFAGINLPERILGFTWNQIHLVFGAYSTLLMLAFLVTNKGVLDAGIGLYLMLFAAIGLLVGAVMRTKEAPTETAGGSYQPPTPF
jgi:hypothetical protein